MSFKYGGVTFPLPASTASSLLADADPAVYRGLDFLAACVQTYAGARLVAEAATCGAPITSAVASTLPYEPGPYLLMEQIPLPGLFLHRRTGRNDYKTLTRAHEKGVLELAYVLPALSPAQAEHILPIRHAIAMLLAHCVEEGADDAYKPPGGDLGDLVWKLAGIEEIDLSDATYGGFAGVGELYLPAITFTLEIKERHEGDIGVPLTGVRAAIAIRAADGTTTDPVANTDVTPP